MSAVGKGPFPNATFSDWADMIDQYQQANLESRLGIPLIYGIDAIHGNSNVCGATIFPHNIGLGATRYSINKKVTKLCTYIRCFLSKNLR